MSLLILSHQYWQDLRRMKLDVQALNLEGHQRTAQLEFHFKVTNQKSAHYCQRLICHSMHEIQL